MATEKRPPGPDDDGATSAVRVTRLPDATADARSDGASATVDLAMTSHDRRRVRRRLVAPDGRTIEIALPTGTILDVGTVLCRVGGTAYRVTAAPERLLEIRPTSLREAAVVGHLIGNLHRDVDVVDDGILALWDEPLERRLRALDLDVRVVERPFGGRPPSEHAH